MGVLIHISPQDLIANMQKIFDLYYDRVLPEKEIDYQYFNEFITLFEALYESYIFQIPSYDSIKIDKIGRAHV